MPNRYLIVGGGLAADAAAKAVRSADPQGLVTLVTAENDGPYRRPHLSKALWNGGTLDKAMLDTAKHGVGLVTGRTVISLDTASKMVTLDDGRRLPYDQVLIATGASARTLPGLAVGGPVVAYRSLDDYRTASSRSGVGKTALVVGGGFVGAELAAGLVNVGTEVHMAFPETGLGANRFPDGLSRAVTDRYAERGVRIHPGVLVESAEVKGDKAEVTLDDGTTGTYDLVAVGVGAAPNVDVARTAGLRVDDGVVVDRALRAADPTGEPVPGVFAAGDVASFPWPEPFTRSRIEHEDAAIQMGRHAGLQMVAAASGEQPAELDHFPFFYSDLFSDGYEAVGTLDGRLRMVEDWKSPNSEGVVYYLNGDKVLGVLLWNTWGQVDAARDLIFANEAVEPESLLGRLPR
ncbi:MAG TPA: FAD-dependent oxidoreductase [Trueperaceae bacterium]|nr:FAD-dependent oxidoreductase [Trueperaceae bacterium]